MKAHLAPTGAQAIPVVMVLDEGFVERAWWGSRPAELQALVCGRRAGITEGGPLSRDRRWYARDRGLTALREVIALLESPASSRAAA